MHGLIGCILNYTFIQEYNKPIMIYNLLIILLWIILHDNSKILNFSMDQIVEIATFIMKADPWINDQ